MLGWFLKKGGEVGTWHLGMRREEKRDGKRKARTRCMPQPGLWDPLIRRKEAFDIKDELF